MDKDKIENNPIVKLSFEFSLSIIDFCEGLEQQRKYVISNQLLKSGTSVGANVMEAQNAESRADFIHKMKIAAKELDETQYWLLLCNYSQHYPECNLLLERMEAISRVLNKIIFSTKNNQNKLS